MIEQDADMKAESWDNCHWVFMKLFKRDTISKQELQVGKGFAKVLNKIGNDVVKLSCTPSILLSVVMGTRSALYGQKHKQ